MPISFAELPNLPGPRETVKKTMLHEQNTYRNNKHTNMQIMGAGNLIPCVWESIIGVVFRVESVFEV